MDALRRAGARGVDREGAHVLALFPPPHDIEPLVREVEAAVRASTTLENPTITCRWEPAESLRERWAAGLAPRRASGRIVVWPGGEPPETRPGDAVVRLLPGPAFGTAEHPTTRACLRLLDSRIRPGDRVLDIGAGSAVLSIAAALLGARRVLALEADDVACAAARANVRENGVATTVEVRELLVRPHHLPGLGRFEGILANLETETLVPLIPAMTPALVSGGWLIVSGVLTQESGRVLEAAHRTGLTPEVADRDAGWWTAGFRSQNGSTAPAA